MNTSSSAVSPQAIGEHIHALRRRYHLTHGGNKLTQEGVARKVGISAEHLARIERGEVNNTGILTLQLIANALDVSLPTLLYGEQQMS